MSRIGKYRERITLQRKGTPVRDPESGEMVGGGWVDAHVGIAAEVLTGPARGEIVTGGAEHAETAARIAFWYRPGITEDMRVLWKAHVFDIGSIEFDATNATEIRLKCTTGVTDGS